MVGAGGCGRAAAPADPATASDLARGAKVFAMYCAACHGDGGRGDGPASVTTRVRPRDLTSEPYGLIEFGPDRSEVRSLMDYIREGNPGSGMPGYPTMPEGDLAAVAGFVRSLRPGGPGGG